LLCLFRVKYLQEIWSTQNILYSTYNFIHFLKNTHKVLKEYFIDSNLTHDIIYHPYPTFIIVTATTTKTFTTTINPPPSPPSCQYILLSLFNFFHSCISLDYLSKIFIISLYILAVILSIIGLGLGDLIMFTILDPRIKGFDHS